MSGRRIECYGGPLDGARPSCSVASEFVWTDGRRSFRLPAKGRHLYRKARSLKVRDLAILLYAEHSYTLCRCGAYHSKRAETCSLCGASLIG